MPEISIIVPVYKVEKYIHSCVESILKQTYTDFELILVDDGSPDNCGYICDEYAKNDCRIRVVHRENGGSSAARNSGMKIATGNYVMFCDSDDYVSPQWCQLMYDAIKSHPLSWCVSDVLRVRDHGEQKIQCKPYCEKSGIKVTNYFDIYKLGLSAYVCNKIYRRDILLELQLEFDESVRFSEDVNFNVEYYKHCENAVLVNTPLYFYFDNSDGIMRAKYRNWMELHLWPFYCRIPVIQDNELGEYCDIWLYQFIQMLDVVFDKENPMSFMQKMKYNQKMLKSEEFSFCINNSAGEKESAAVLKILKKQNYYIYWLFQKAIELKRKIKGN